MNENTETNCQYCDKKLEKYYTKKFCSRSCAAKFNNLLRVKHKETYKCLHCNIEKNYLPFLRSKFCSEKCSQQFRKNENRERNYQLFQQGKLRYRMIIYEFLKERDGNKCSICNLPGEWQGKPIRHWVDHIDGNASNHMPNNFRLVCPNCESQLPTSRGHNWGKGRKSRGMPSYD